MNILALITAKSYSTRVVDKNRNLLMKKPLYQWTTDFLVRNRKKFDAIFFSSDNPSKFDLPEGISSITRPKILCEDNVPHIMSVKHGLINAEHMHDVEFDYVILFQPTNPFRSSIDLDSMIESINKYKPTLVKTYYVDDNISPGYVLGATFDGEINEDGIVVRSGNMYAYSRKYLLGMHFNDDPDTIYIYIPKRRGYNINNDDDFVIVESMMRKYKCELKK